jgi:hypothetical protein
MTVTVIPEGGGKKRHFMLDMTPVLMKPPAKSQKVAGGFISTLAY